jgi:hypothetical protein
VCDTRAPMKKLIAILMLGLAACGGPVGEVGDESADAISADGLSTTRDTYIRVRRDYRRCVSPMCGGYWASDLNSTAQERYVSGLDFAGSVLDNEVQADIFNAGEGEVVLFGRLGAREARFGTRPFMVTEAYRGMPGVSVAAGDKFYGLAQNEIFCIRAPCPSIGVRLLNRAAGQPSATDLSVKRALQPFVDAAWLNDRLMSRRAVLAGTVRTQGENIIVDASQVFVQLPDRIQGCPKVAVPMCGSGKIVGWNRTPNRCSLPSGCVTPRVCTRQLPVCAEGYSLIEVQNTCPTYSCEPTFLDD